MYFASKADVEGFNDAAAVFRSTAEGETGHAFGHLEFLAEVGDPATGEPIGSTTDNLKAAIAGEIMNILICILVWQEQLEKKVLKKLQTGLKPLLKLKEVMPEGFKRH